jgi:hypothetical protein
MLPVVEQNNLDDSSKVSIDYSCSHLEMMDQGKSRSRCDSSIGSTGNGNVEAGTDYSFSSGRDGNSLGGV